MIKLFPTLIHEFKIPDFRQETLLRYCYEERDKNIEGVFKSNRGGWQSQDHYCLFNNPINTALRLSLSDWVNNSNTFEKGTQMEVQAMWININGNGSYNMKHNHPNSDMSGVFWIKGTPEQGCLTFDDPCNYSRFQEVVCYSTEFKEEHGLWNQFRFEPSPGEGVIFPSCQDHAVEENKTDEDRISVSFNMRLDIDFNSANIATNKQI